MIFRYRTVLVGSSCTRIWWRSTKPYRAFAHKKAEYNNITNPINFESTVAKYIYIYTFIRVYDFFRENVQTECISGKSWLRGHIWLHSITQTNFRLEKYACVVYSNALHIINYYYHNSVRRQKMDNFHENINCIIWTTSLFLFYTIIVYLFILRDNWYCLIRPCRLS